MHSRSDSWCKIVLLKLGLLEDGKADMAMTAATAVDLRQVANVCWCGL